MWWGVQGDGQFLSSLRGGSVLKTLSALAGDAKMQVQSLSQEDSPRERNGNPLQYSCLENPIYREACQATVHGLAKYSDTTEHARTIPLIGAPPL